MPFDNGANSLILKALLQNYFNLNGKVHETPELSSVLFVKDKYVTAIIQTEF